MLKTDKSLAIFLRWEKLALSGKDLESVILLGCEAWSGSIYYGGADFFKHSNNTMGRLNILIIIIIIEAHLYNISN